MNIAARFFRDRRRSLVGWSIGVAVVSFLVTAMFPSVEGQTGLEETFRQLPAALRAAVGAGEDISIISATGFLHGRLFAVFGPLLFTIFGIGLGARLIGGDEQEKTLELLLANPVTRQRFAAERIGVMVVLMALLALVLMLSVYAFSQIIGGSLTAIGAGRLLEATLGAMMLATVFASIAYAVGAVTGRKSKAVTVATTLAVGTYLVQVLTASDPSLGWLAALSPWRWYLDDVILVHGLPMRAVALPLLTSTVLLTAGTAAFVRRDLR